MYIILKQAIMKRKTWLNKLANKLNSLKCTILEHKNMSVVGMLEEIPLGGRCGKKSWFKILMFVQRLVMHTAERILRRNLCSSRQLISNCCPCKGIYHLLVWKSRMFQMDSGTPLLQAVCHHMANHWGNGSTLGESDSRLSPERKEIPLKVKKSIKQYLF